MCQYRLVIPSKCKKSVKIPKKFPVSPPIRVFVWGHPGANMLYSSRTKAAGTETTPYSTHPGRGTGRRIWYGKSAGSVFIIQKSEKTGKIYGFPPFLGKKGGDRQKEIRYLYGEKAAAGSGL